MTDTSNPSLLHALKEWAVAVEALTSGTTILLMRKGGIRERRGRFSVEFDRALLYPTEQHQQFQAATNFSTLKTLALNFLKSLGF